MAIRYGMMALAGAVAASAAMAAGPPFSVQEVKSLSAMAPGDVKPRTVYVMDIAGSPILDPSTGLIKFEDWIRERPVEARFLSLYPGYQEPTINVTVLGTTRPYKEKLHVYVSAARFIIQKPAAQIRLEQYGTVPFLERIDPAIKHERVAAVDVRPLKDADWVHSRHPQRAWCSEPALCLRSVYKFEGKLPVGIKLANKLEDGGKKIADYLEFESEVRPLPPEEIAGGGLAELTGLKAPVVAAIEQSIFYVNQVMQFGKFLAVLQADRQDANRTFATVFIALGVESDVLELKKEYREYPVLRNLVPVQVLMGKSSFNTGTSLSAGLPVYTRNNIRAIAGILDGE
jgi:hypothetical protein